MSGRPDVQQVKQRLRAKYQTLEGAIADLSPKEVYRENEGANYPSRDLVRRVWNYGQPGTDVVPDAGGPDHNGWKALLKLLGEVEARHAVIACDAYRRYQARGRTDGHDLDDWLAAERDLEIK